MVNRQVFEQAGLPVPTSWRQLTDPRYRGMIGMRSPVVSGTAYTTVATLVQLMGEQQAFAYLAKLQANLNTGHYELPARVRAGKLGLTITFLHESPHRALSQGQRHPVDFIVPSEGTGYEIGAVSLVNNAPHPEVAKRFLDYLFSEQGMAIFDKYENKYARMLVLKSQQKPELDFLSQDVNLIDFDFVWAGKNRARLLQRYQQQIAIISRAMGNGVDNK